MERRADNRLRRAWSAYGSVSGGDSNLDEYPTKLSIIKNIQFYFRHGTNKNFLYVTTYR